jgi:hypothetical protein
MAVHCYGAPERNRFDAPSAMRSDRVILLPAQRLLAVRNWSGRSARETILVSPIQP